MALTPHYTQIGGSPAITGAGFGGCTVTLIEEDAIPAYQEHILQYERIFGFKPEVYVCRPSAGARIVENRVQSE